MNTHRRLSTPAVFAVGLPTTIALVALIALTGGSPRASAEASPTPSQIAIASQSPSASASATPAAPSALPSPTATPSSPLVWSKPRIVEGLDDCTSVVAAIDDSGTNHLAATCGSQGGEIHYSASTDGRTWTTTTFKPPTNRLEQDPQLAFDGNKLYLAYTRLAPEDGGCGADGLADVGVYYRVRTMPNGDWSAPTRLGAVADHLQSFRVSGAIHAIVTNETDGKTSYERLSGSMFSGYPIVDAAGSVSLRIGDDGKPRIAYEGSNGIEYGVFAKRGFSTDTIAGTAGGWDPVLALAPGNAAYVLWNRSYHAAGCAEPGPDPADGTYFATNASGRWVSSRLTTLVGGASLALDPATGDIHALVSDFQRLVYYRKAADGAWTHSTIGNAGSSSPVIRENPKTGALLVAYVSNPTETHFSVQVLTKP
jgi:hypothetical protein